MAAVWQLEEFIRIPSAQVRPRTSPEAPVEDFFTSSRVQAINACLYSGDSMHEIADNFNVNAMKIHRYVWKHPEQFPAYRFNKKRGRRKT